MKNRLKKDSLLIFFLAILIVLLIMPFEYLIKKLTEIKL